MYILDTNVISECRKSSPEPKVIEWLNSVNTNECYISVMTLFEIEVGILRKSRKDKTQADALRVWFNNVIKHFSLRALDITSDISFECARLQAVTNDSLADCLIAATANVNNMTVVTRNESDFTHLCRVMNPWNM